MELPKRYILSYYAIITTLLLSTMIYFLNNRIDDPPSYTCDTDTFNSLAILIAVFISIAITCLIIELWCSYCGDYCGMCVSYMVIIIISVIIYIIASVFIANGLKPISNNKSNFDEVYYNITGKWNETIHINDYCMKVYYYTNNTMYIGVQYILLFFMYILGASLLVIKNPIFSVKIKYLHLFILLIQSVIVICAIASIMQIVINADYSFTDCNFDIKSYYSLSLSVVVINILWVIYCGNDSDYIFNQKFYNILFFAFNAIKSIIAWLVFIRKDSKYNECSDSITGSPVFWYFALDNLWIFLGVFCLFLKFVLNYILNQILKWYQTVKLPNQTEGINQTEGSNIPSSPPSSPCELA